MQNQGCSRERCELELKYSSQSVVVVTVTLVVLSWGWGMEQWVSILDTRLYVGLTGFFLLIFELLMVLVVHVVTS